MFEWIELFNSLSEEEKSTLSMFCQIRNLKSWDILFKEWEEANSMYILKSWLLEAYRDNKILWNINPWEVVWEMAIMKWNWKRSASVKALKDSSLITILSFSVKELTQKHPDITEKLMDIIKKRS